MYISNVSCWFLCIAKGLPQNILTAVVRFIFSILGRITSDELTGTASQGDLTKLVFMAARVIL